MKLGFKKLCCMGMALLFSLNLANVSLSVKAESEPSSVVEQSSVVKQGEVQGDLVIPKEIVQEIVNQHLKNASKSEKSAMATFILAAIGGAIGLDDFYLGKWELGVLEIGFTVVTFFMGVLPIHIVVSNFIRAALAAAELTKDSKGLPVKF